MFHELLSIYATSESLCALDASLRRFLPRFCGMETSIVLGGNGTIQGFPAPCLCCFVSSGIPVNARMKGFPAQSTLFTSAVMVLMPWLICVCTSPCNKTLISKVIYNNSPGPLLAAVMPHPG